MRSRIRGSLAASIACISIAAVSAADLPLGAVTAASGVTVPGLPPVTGRIHVDQFGYLPDESKFAVISDPQAGYNALESFTAGRMLELRRRSDGATVHRGEARLWRRGAVHADSGDRGWWFDFSSVRETGDYYVFDAGNGVRSHLFRIDKDVYRDVLRTAVRTFYYQRENLERQPPFAEEPWVDGVMFPQDGTARALWAKDDPTTERDLRGGWMDAGDTNKYVTFLRDVIPLLLYAWQRSPGAFTDDFDIPESGNDLPDLLDEVMYELDWLVRMQDDDGGFFIKLGTIDYAGAFPLSADRRPRYYGPKCSSATIIACGILAQAARVFGQFEPWHEKSGEFRERAERAWRWYQSHPRSAECDSGEIKSGDADKTLEEQDAAAAIAAMHLFVLTGQQDYHATFKHGLESTRQMREPGWSAYEPGYGEALLEYTTLPQADATVRARIVRRIRRAFGDRSFSPRPPDSLYRSFMPADCYHWGSNFVRSALGSAANNAIEYGLSDDRDEALRQRALDLLHSFHGVNPLGVVYLSNMSDVGAEVSVQRLWHDWFNFSTPFAANPVPGYVVGGPNRSFGGRGELVAWIRQQPPDKAYADFNEGHPLNSWELSEPAIYYQAAYVRLLATFVADGHRARE